MQFFSFRSNRSSPTSNKSKNSRRGTSVAALADRVHRANQRLALESLESRCMLSTLYVATNGSDSGAGSSSSPYQTIQKAVDTVAKAVKKATK